MTVKNRVCELLGCEYPVIEGGLAYVGNGRLAAAVSEGGGFGQIGSGGRTPENLRQEIEVALQTTSQPLGINLPISEHKDISAYIDIILSYAGKIRAVSLSAGNPRPWIALLKEAGFVVMTLTSTPEQAKKVEESGSDLVICEGMEAGGHNGTSELSSMVLVPLVCDAVSIPVVAAGGIVDHRTASAAFALGAEGIQMGTRFVATQECEAHPSYKARLVSAQSTDTRIIERTLGRVTRVLNSPLVQQILQQEKETPGDESRLLSLVSGRMNKVAAIDGQLDKGFLNCGLNVGLIQTVSSAFDVVREVMASR
jgi:NAD(P)H-dependent flavin oxidoreductase YrpB (nitropropane dioxygenase family)